MTGMDSMEREVLLLVWSRPSCWAADVSVLPLMLGYVLGWELSQASRMLTMWRVKCAGKVPGVFLYVAGKGEGRGMVLNIDTR